VDTRKRPSVHQSWPYQPAAPRSASAITGRTRFGRLRLAGGAFASTGGGDAAASPVGAGVPTVESERETSRRALAEWEAVMGGTIWQMKNGMQSHRTHRFGELDIKPLHRHIKANRTARFEKVKKT